MGNDCTKTCGIVLLIVGLYYLLADFGVLDLGISWWTAAFILMGAFKLMGGKK